jgi:hypothetical protein
MKFKFKKKQKVFTSTNIPAMVVAKVAIDKYPVYIVETRYYENPIHGGTVCRSVWGEEFLKSRI